MTLAPHPPSGPPRQGSWQLRVDAGATPASPAASSRSSSPLQEGSHSFVRVQGAAASAISTQVRQWIYRRVVQQLGLDADFVKEVGDLHDGPIGHFCREGGSQRLMWFCLHPALDTTLCADGPSGKRSGSITAESEAHWRSGPDADNDDAVSRASFAFSTASCTFSVASSRATHLEDESQSSRSSGTSSIEDHVIVSCDKVFPLTHYSCVYFIRTDPVNEGPQLTAQNVHTNVLVGRIAPTSRGSNPELLMALLDRMDVFLYPAISCKMSFGELTSALRMKTDSEKRTKGTQRSPADTKCAGDVPRVLQPDNIALRVPEVKGFVSECLDFRTSVFDIGSSMKLTIMLAKPTRRFDIDFQQKAMHKAAQKREVVQNYEQCIYQWRDQIERVLAQGMAAMPSRAIRTTCALAPVPESGHPAGEDARKGKYGDDDGPDCELLFWKVRTTQLNHIVDQLQSKPNRVILSVLGMAGQRAAHCMTDWQEISTRLHEAAQEAKDNVKYLLTLENFTGAFYEADPSPQHMIQTLPQCINVIKMIHAISRYYNTSERMTGLFVKITNQMIRSCRRFIECNGTVWDQPPKETIQALKSCVELNEAYKFYFRQTKEELSAKLFGRHFDFSEEAIFGKFNLFCGRLQKLIDVMHVRQQFDLLRRADNIDNVMPLAQRFDEIMTVFRAQAHDGYLQANSHDFDLFYQQFKQSVQELSLELIVFINNCFLTVNDTTKALQLLARFRAVLSNQHINKLLEEKHAAVFTTYGRDLETIKAMYEKDKDNPPCPRNMPPVAGAISWARQLLRKIELPMKLFQESPHILQTRDARRIIRNYNRAARTFVTFEARWYEAWKGESVLRARAGLQATLLVCDKQSTRVHVNFDAEVLQLIREVHCLQRMGLPVPQEALPIYSQRHALLRANEELNYIVHRYYALVDNIDPLHCGIVIPHINKLNAAINPGLVQYQWTSLNIDAYIADVSGILQSVESMVQRVNGVMRCRMDASCEEIRGLSWICLTSSLSSSAHECEAAPVHEIVSMQQSHAHQIAHRISVLNYEVAAATREVVQMTSRGYTAADVHTVQDSVEELYQVYEHKVFQAILHCMQQSVLYLKARLVGPGETTQGPAPFLFERLAIFSVEVLVRNRGVEVSPSLEEVQRCVNRMARAMLESTRGIFRWRQDERAPCEYDVVEYQGAVLRAEEAQARKSPLDGLQVAEDAQDSSDSDGPYRNPKRTRLKSLFLRIGKNRRMTKVFLQLTGAVSGLQEQLSAFLLQFHAFDALLKSNRADEMEAFNARTDLSFSEYEEKIRFYFSLEKDVQRLPNNYVIGCLHIDLARVKATLLNEAQAWKRAYGTSLNNRVKAAMDELVQNTEDLTAKLNRRVQDLSDVNAIMAVINRIRLDESVIDMKLRPIVATYELLYRFNVKVTKEEQDQVDRIGFQWNSLVQQSRSHMDYLQEVGPRFKRVLLHDVSQFQKQVGAFKADYDRNGPMVPDIEPRLAVERLKAFQKQHAEKQRKLFEYRMGEELFGLPMTNYPEMERIDRELKLLSRLYDLYTEVLMRLQQYEEVLWGEVDVEDMRECIKGFRERIRRLPRGLRDWQAYHELRDIVEEFLDTLPLIELLSLRSVVDRHWKELSRICGVEFNYRAVDFRLKSVLSAKLTVHRVEIEELATAAQKESEIEQKLARIQEEWAGREVTLAPFKNRGMLTLKPDATSELLTRVEEAQATLTSLLSSRFNDPFKRDIILWVQRLTTVQERIAQWLEVQHLWIYMEAVFSGSGDIGKEMPTEVKRFSNIDRQWAKIMRTAAETPNVLRVCVHSDMLSNLLPHLRHYLDLCQKSLSGYLAQKRHVFPRFYFVSNAQLLEILGQASDPSTIQAHMPSLTNNVYRVTFEPGTRRVMSITSGEGEQIGLRKPVSTDRDVVEWLQSFLLEVQRTLKHIGRAMIQDLHGVDSSVADLKQWIEAYPAQLSLVGLQVLWTADCEQALSLQKSEKSAMAVKARKAKAIQEHLVNLTKYPDLSARMRTNVEALITVQIHHNDVLFTLSGSGRGKFRVRSTGDFEWLKQMRFYWKVESNSCVGTVTDIDFPYAFEYVGCVERLVITDLTDRIYISCAQAMGMGYGGSPTGPAGTGKTETVKDMGRSFARYVIITNCSDQMNVDTMGNMFKGIAMSGCWCGFDEINRVEVQVLSVVAAQVASLLNGRRNRQCDITFPDGVTVSLDPLAAVFVTFNPGYGGRSQLPENMKALFRPIAVVVPDRQAIIRVRLAAAGFQDSLPLSKKFATLYKLCEEQLSKQRHYDFGLRNILSVLRVCGSELRRALEKGVKDLEKSVLVQVLRDMNLSKLVDHAHCSDGLLFGELVKDIFPGVVVPDSSRRDMHKSIILEAERDGLVRVEMWETKVLQLFEQWRVRHGLCLMGPAGVGKSKGVQVLGAAMTRSKMGNVRINKLNPKSLTVTEIYGRHDRKTSDWSDGVLTALWRKAVRRRDDHTWIVLDGPVDPQWIESLNTVLDDTRTLSLPNNERLVMTSMLRLIFEVENLDNASPATVSRVGLVYMSESCLGWRPQVRSWLQKQRLLLPDQQEILHSMLVSLCARALQFIAVEGLTLCLDVSQHVLVSNCLRFAEGLLGGRIALPSATAMGRVVLFSVVWGIGGMLNESGRAKLQACLADTELNLGSSTKPMPLPSAPEGTVTDVYDYFIEAASGKWSHWSELVPFFEYPMPPMPEPRFHNIFVPTMESVRLQYLVDCATRTVAARSTTQRHVLLLGPSGSGKTVTVKDFLKRSGKTGTVVAKGLSLSAATTPASLQVAIESYVDKISGTNWGPPPGKRLVIFMDDLCLPELNVWGDQPTCELIRQVVEDGAFFSLSRTEAAERYSLVDVQVVAAMPYLRGTRYSLPNRLRRHFCLVNAEHPSNESVEFVYHCILGGHFSELRGFSDEVTNAALQLVPTIRKFNDAAKVLAARYTFSLRDISKVIEGMCRAPPASVTTVADVLLLYEHEVHRVYADKVMDEAEAEAMIKKCTQGIEGQWPDGGPPSVDNIWADFSTSEAPEDFVEDEAGGLAVVDQPRVYQRVLSTQALGAKVRTMLVDLNANYPKRRMHLVLFDFAVKHVARISRVLHTPRGSLLVVGMGGSGRQSLVKLASFVAGHKLFQLPPGAMSHSLFLEDLKEIHRVAALGPPVTFLANEEDLVLDPTLEVLNVLLTGGQVVGLQQRDEMELLMEELRPLLERQADGAERHVLAEQLATPDGLLRIFHDRVRDRLHIVMCFSLVGRSLETCARRFPGFANCCSNVFHPWPKEALLATAQEQFSTLQIHSGGGKKSSVAQHAAQLHVQIGELATTYHQQLGRTVFITSSAFLEFLGCFVSFYSTELAQLLQQRQSVQGGLTTLQQAQEDVTEMKMDLGQKRQTLDAAALQLETLLYDIRDQAEAAEEQTKEVQLTRNQLVKQSQEIQKEKEDAEEQLQAAEPALRAAEAALRTIRPDDIATLKKLQNPPVLIRRILDGVIILRNFPLETPVHCETDGQGGRAVRASWSQGKAMVADLRFLPALNEFDRDSVSDEHCELLQPYLAMEDFTVERARSACGSLAGLCTWIRSMVHYRDIAKAMGPKRARLAVAEEQQFKARRELAKSEKELAEKQAALDDMRHRYQKALDEQAALKEDAEQTRRKLLTAESLIMGLNEERDRWSQQSQEFHRRSLQLTGDAALVAAFLCYAPPFNHLFRGEIFAAARADLAQRKLPVTDAHSFSLINLLSTEGQRGSWALEGLPTDDLSVQNACIVSRCARCPLLIDPQAQGRRWLVNSLMRRGLVQTNTAQKGWLRRAEEGFREGKPVLLEDLEDSLDPALDNVIAKKFLRTTTSDGQTVNLCTVGDHEIEISENFAFYMATKLPNPKFAPSVFTKCVVLDFTVTRGGLADQLLGTVIQHEKASLEEDRRLLLEEMQSCRAVLVQCEEELLSRLSQQNGRLLDDTCLIEILSATKEKSVEVNEKLTSCRETEQKIAYAREEYRPAARHGSVLYFAVAAIAQVEHMYETSLDQFLAHFGAAIDGAPPSPVPARRVANIVDHQTQHLFRAMLRGYYSQDKFLFTLLCALSIEEEAGNLTHSEITSFLKGGAALDPNEHPCQLTWIDSEAWVNACALEHRFAAFRRLTFAMSSFEQEWQKWFESSAPEVLSVPPGIDELRVSPFASLALVRSLRPDRTANASRRWVAKVLGPGLVEVPPMDLAQMGGVVAETGPLTPILLLLSSGGDPGAMIEALARRGRTPVTVVSMGDAQEPIAAKNVQTALAEGGWVVLQNAHLSLNYCRDLVETLRQFALPTATTGAAAKFAHESCRIWLTAQPDRKFPLTLLQQSIKVALEPPQGMRAGLATSYQLITQDQLDSINQGEWRVTLFTLCFLHSALSERRKYGALGFAVPYEFSHHDLAASQTFLYNYLYTDIKKGISWKTVQYMICDVQYGGRVTDSFDMRVLTAYGEKWLRDELFERAPEFTFYHGYRAPDFMVLADYHKYIGGLPADDRPELLGMHSSAGLELNRRESSRLLQAALSVLPREGVGSPAAREGRRDALLRFTRLVEQRLSVGIQSELESYVKRTSKQRGGAPPPPLDIFLRHEVHGVMAIVEIIRVTCADVRRLAVDASFRPTDAVERAADAIFDGAVPESWRSAGIPLSRLGAWVDHLARRQDNLMSWLRRGVPRCHWIPGYGNPQAFLTALRQEGARSRHATWSLETVVVRSEVTKYVNPDNLHQDPPEGCAFVIGFTLSGASWDRQGAHLTESSARALGSPLPVVLLKCQQAGQPDGRLYQCPVYRDPARTMQNYIFSLGLRCGDCSADTWVLRGAAVLCVVTD